MSSENLQGVYNPLQEAPITDPEADLLFAKEKRQFLSRFTHLLDDIEEGHDLKETLTLIEADEQEIYEVWQGFDEWLTRGISWSPDLITTIIQTALNIPVENLLGEDKKFDQNVVIEALKQGLAESVYTAHRYHTAPLKGRVEENDYVQVECPHSRSSGNILITNTRLSDLLVLAAMQTIRVVGDEGKSAFQKYKYWNSDRLALSGRELNEITRKMGRSDTGFVIY